MAELNIGKHCSYANCNLLDFLPCPCNKCGLDFCKDHMSYESHKCTGKDQISVNSGTGGASSKSYACSVKDCNRKELVPIVCDSCGEYVCLLHRHPVDHTCRNFSPTIEKMSKTAEEVAQILKSREISKKKKPVLTSQSSKAMNTKLALMKLKMKAVGDKGIPESDRVFFNVLLPQGSKNSTASVYLSKTWAVGRAVDNLSTTLNIKNENNKASARRLCLFSGTSGIILPSDQRLETLLDSYTDANETKPAVYNGCTLILDYIDRGSNQLSSLEPYAKLV